MIVSWKNGKVAVIDGALRGDERDSEGYLAMSAGLRGRMIRIMAGAGLAALMLFSWLDPGLYADSGNHLNGGSRCRSFAI